MSKRINPETGVFEEGDDNMLLDLIGVDTWQPEENENGNIERINPETGVHEEGSGILGGMFGYIWQSKD